MHINKCAGTSAHSFFKANNIGVHNCNAGDHHIVKQFENDVKYLTTVRNPYNRVVSHFNQWVKNGWMQDIDLNTFVSKLGECYEDNSPKKILTPAAFNRWSNLGTESPVSIKFLKPCSYWIQDSNRFKIFKFENISEMNYFFSETGYKIKKKIEEVKEQSTITDGLPSYIDKLNDDSIKIINELFAEDFQNFNYEKKEIK